MQFSAKLIELLPLQTGNGKNGTWKKQDIIVETDGQYPKKVCVAIWGDKADESVLQIGNQLNISFDIESREFNGRWYTDVKAWKIEAEETGASNNNNSNYKKNNNSRNNTGNEAYNFDSLPEYVNVSSNTNEDDDLPF